MKVDWKCSCGCHNTGKFCVNCGLPRNKIDKPADAVVLEEWFCVCKAQNTTPYCTNCGKKESDFKHIKTTTVKSEIISLILLVAIIGGFFLSVKNNFFQTGTSDTDIGYALKNVKETLYDIETLSKGPDSKDVVSMTERIVITRNTLKQIYSNLKNVSVEAPAVDNNIPLVVEKYDMLAAETVNYITNSNDRKRGEELVNLANEVTALIDNFKERKKGIWYSVSPTDYGKKLKVYGKKKVSFLQKRITDEAMDRKALVWITTESKIFNNKLYIDGYYVNNDKKVAAEVGDLNLEIEAFNEYGEKLNVITKKERNIKNNESVQPGNKLTKSIAVDLDEFDEGSSMKLFVVKQLE